MKSGQLVVFGIAALAAGGAGYTATQLTSSDPLPIEQVSAQPQISLGEVLVATQDIPVGSEVGSFVRWQEWPTAAITQGYITRDAEPDALDSIGRSIARLGMMEGEPVRRIKLLGEGQSLMSAILPSGKKAIATQISADTSAGGFILPNDTVDVIMTRRQPSANGGAEVFETETILTNIRVLAIDQTIQENEDGQQVKVGETATLELTAQQAEIITVAQQMADRLTLALRSVADANEEEQMSAEHLVNGAGRGDSVRLIKSGTITEVGAR